MYSAINIIGLAVSLAAGILLLLWVWDELSFDSFHTKAERLYRIAASFDKAHKEYWSVAPAPVANFAKREIPGVEDACRISDNEDMLVEYKGKKFTEKKNCYADPAFFTMFDFPLKEGNLKKPFPNNRSIIMSATTAKKYFGEEPATGKNN